MQAEAEDTWGVYSNYFDLQKAGIKHAQKLIKAEVKRLTEKHSSGTLDDAAFNSLSIVLIGLDIVERAIVEELRQSDMRRASLHEQVESLYTKGNHDRD